MEMYTIPIPKIQNILVVEDEPEIRSLISISLKRNGFEVIEAADGLEARDSVSKNIELIVLDWMLPHLSGLEITRFVRQDHNLKQIPILFVTAKASPEEITMGLDAGADDYMTKPFDQNVLLARVHALLRRKKWLELPLKNRLQLGPLEMDLSTFEAKLNSQNLELTRSEFLLLQTLLQNQGRVLSRSALIEQIQGEGVNVVGRTIDTHVFGLRKKLGNFGDMIDTIRGVGYRVQLI